MTSRSLTKKGKTYKSLKVLGYFFNIYICLILV